MATKITKAVVISRLATYSGEAQLNKELQNRLKLMVKNHGIELTALAAGFTVATLGQYIRVNHAPSLNYKSVIKAEYILSGE